MSFLIIAIVGLGFAWLWTGLLLWAVCGLPELRFTYVKRIIFAWPALALSRNYYALYMRERSEELSEDFERRDHIQRSEEYYCNKCGRHHENPIK
jgi:hypothetical protein